jgi:lipoate-protein ligase A
VLGSAQRAEVADAEACAAAGIEVVHRRSGGGAVLVVPGDLLWVDLVIPADDELWETDVGRAFGWVGASWHRALAEVGVATEVHAGPLVRTAWSPLVCFAGLGPGELTLPGRATKVVGISQRRTRAAARFQCAALRRWDPHSLTRLLALDPVERSRATGELADVAGGIPVAVEALLSAFLRHLP